MKAFVSDRAELYIINNNGLPNSYLPHLES